MLLRPIRHLVALTALAVSLPITAASGSEPARWGVVTVAPDLGPVQGSKPATTLLASPQCVVPAAPALSASPPTVVAGQYVQLTWTDDPYLSVSYDVYYSWDLVSWTWLKTQGTTGLSVKVNSSGYSTIWFFVRSTEPSCLLHTDSNVVAVGITTGGGGCVGPPAPTLASDHSSVAIGQNFTLSWNADPYSTTEYFWVGTSTTQSGTYNQVGSNIPSTQTTKTISFNSSATPGTYYFRVWAYPHGGATCEPLKTFSNAVAVTVTSGGGGGACVADSQTLCLSGGRFKVQTTWSDYSAHTGTGTAVSLGADSGYFWFFDSANAEVIAKFHSFCNGSSGSWGLYASGLTDIQVTFKVTDTVTSTYREYTNALGSRFCTISDAWAVCP